MAEMWPRSFRRSSCTWRRRGSSMAVSRLYLGYISAASRLHLGCISAASRLHLGYVSAISPLHLGCISAVSPPPARSALQLRNLARAGVPRLQVTSGKSRLQGHALQVKMSYKLTSPSYKLQVQATSYKPQATSHKLQATGYTLAIQCRTARMQPLMLQRS